MTFYSRTTDIIDRMVDDIWNYIIYLRKSRSDSPLESVEEVLSKHEKMLQDFAMKTFGQHIPEENIFREVVSGETIADRPEMKKVLSRIESKNMKGVLVVEPQRLSRGDLVDCGNIIRAFKFSDTKILTPMKTYDLHDRFDEKFFKDELMRGAEYLEYTKEILSRGRLASVAEGNFIGAHPPYGYDKIMIQEGHKKCPSLVINESEANVVRMIFDMYANQNMTPYRIIQTIEGMGIKPRTAKLFADSTIRDILSNYHYIGKVVWNLRKTEINYVDGELVKTRPRNEDFLIFDGKHPAIIDDETWNRAQERRGKNPPIKGDRELVNVLGKLLYCDCGYSMSLQFPSKNKSHLPARYVCRGKRLCNTRSVKHDDVIDAVVEGLKLHLEDFEIKLKNGDGDSEKLQVERLEHIQKELEEVERQQEKLFDLLERGIYDEETFVKRNKVIVERREELRTSYNKLKSTLPSSIDYEDKIVKLSQAIEAIKDPTLSVKVKNDFLHEIVEKIVYKSYIVDPDRGGRWGTSRFELDIFLRV